LNLNPLKLGWKEEDGSFMPLLSMKSPALPLIASYSLSDVTAMPPKLDLQSAPVGVRASRTILFAQNCVGVEEKRTHAPMLSRALVVMMILMMMIE